MNLYDTQQQEEVAIYEVNKRILSVVRIVGVAKQRSNLYHGKMEEASQILLSQNRNRLREYLFAIPSQKTLRNGD